MRKSELPLLSLVAAIALRFLALDRHDLWVDEAISVKIASDGHLLADVVRFVTELPLYHALLSLWAHVAFSLAGLRAFSAALAGLALVRLACSATRRYGREVGAAALVFAGGSAFLLYYSQEMRPYSLILLLSLMAIDSVWKLADGEVSFPRAAVSYAVALILLLYTHYFGFLFLGASALGGLAYPRLRAIGPRWLALHVCAAACFLPWLPHALASLSGGPSLDRIGPHRHLLLDLAAPFAAFPLGKTLIPTPGTDGFAWEAAAFAAGLLGAGVLGVAGVRSLLRSDRRADAIYGSVLLLLPLVAAVVLTRLGLPLYNFARVKYLIFAYPLFPLAFAHGWQALDRRVGSVCAVLLLAANAVALGNYYFNPEYLRAPRYRDALVALAGVRSAEESLACPSQWTFLPVKMTARLEGIEIGRLHGLYGSAPAGDPDLAGPADLPVGRGACVWRIVYVEWRARGAADRIAAGDGAGWAQAGFVVIERHPFLGLRLDRLRRD